MDENCLNFHPQAEADVQQEAFVKPPSGRSAYSRFSMADVHVSPFPPPPQTGRQAWSFS